MEFFPKLGFTFNPQLTDETATCMIVSDDIFIFMPKTICGATTSTEVPVCLSRESRAHVDDTVRQAVAAGGTLYNDPQDHGFMYSHGFQDLDGHMWELMSMEPSALSRG